MFAHKIVPVGHADAQADADEQRQIRKVIAYVTDFGVLHLGGFTNPFIGLDFFQGILLKEMDSQILDAVFDHGRTASGNDAGFETGVVGQAEAQAIAGVKAFGFEHAAAGPRHVIEFPVGHDPVHIHQQHLIFLARANNLRGYFAMVLSSFSEQESAARSGSNCSGALLSRPQRTCLPTPAQTASEEG